MLPLVRPSSCAMRASSCARQATPASVTLDRGSGPRQLAFHPNGRVLYVLTQVSSELLTYQWDSSKGALKRVQLLPTELADFKGVKSGAHIEVSADGRFVEVLGVARGLWRGEGWPASQHDFDFEFLGLVGLADPPRPEVPAAVAACQQAGIRIIMMTGDHPETARAIARQVGLAAGDVLTGSEIAQMDDALLRKEKMSVRAPFDGTVDGGGGCH